MHCTQWSRELARVGCDVTLTSWQQWRHSVQRCCCYDNSGGCLAEYSANEKRQRHDRCRGTIHVVHYSGQWAGTCPPKTAPSCWGNWTPSNAVMSHFEYMLNTCCPAPVSYLDTPFLCCLFLGLFLGARVSCRCMRGCAYSWIFSDGQGQGALNWIDDIDGWVQQTCHNVIMALCACVSNPRNGQPALSSLVSTLLW